MGKGGSAGKGGEILNATETTKVATAVSEVAGNKDNDKTNTIDTTTKNMIDEVANASRPWYVRGGFHVNMVGIGLNALIPPLFLVATAAADSLHPSITTAQIFAAVVFVQAAVALAEGMVTLFCVLNLPVYLAALLVIPATLRTDHGGLPLVALSFVGGMWRTGACMSVCLHRYASHAAFKCGPATRLFLNVLGCAANQGGPIWWASQHRCHHKHCDVPRDPHSARLDGVEAAFAFFSLGHGRVEEEFAPRHNDTWGLRLLDTFAFAVCTAELLLSYRYFGREGLFVSSTSMWLCKTVTLWFNIANHPPDAHAGKACQAADFMGRPTGWYPGFLFLDAICPYFSKVASEDAHEHHHVHFMLAKREKYDCMYHTFVWPLEKLGLVWDVKVAAPE